MNNIETEWQRYKEMCVPKNAGDRQVVETRRSFLAGALAVHNLMLDNSEEGCMKILRHLLSECNKITEEARLEALLAREMDTLQ